MSAWEEAFDSLGPEGRELRSQLKDAFEGSATELSAFLVSEAGRVKGWLNLLAARQIGARSFARLIDNEKYLIQQHVLTGATKAISASEQAAGKLLLAAIEKLIDRVL